jgi:hypothetical protein
MEFIVSSFDTNRCYSGQMYHVAKALEEKRRSNRKVNSAMRYCKTLLMQLRKNGHILSKALF